MSKTMNNSVFSAFQKEGCHSWSLYFDKFSGYNRQKNGILSEIISKYDRSKDFIKKQMEQKYHFFLKMAEKKNMRILYFENTTKLLVNMGHALVLENVGFSFERIFGIPCVPGSALKGVVANLALWEANGDAAFEDKLLNFKIRRSLLPMTKLLDIFGGNEGDEVQGKINFYGIFPMEVPKLEIDIITPHQGGKIIPNHFLAIAPGTLWYIQVSYNREDDGSSFLNETERVIEACLINFGVGAKVASGYGKFVIAHPNKLSKLKKNLEPVKVLTPEEQFKVALESSALEHFSNFEKLELYQKKLLIEYIDSKGADKVLNSTNNKKGKERVEKFKKLKSGGSL